MRTLLRKFKSKVWIWFFQKMWWKHLFGKEVVNQVTLLDFLRLLFLQHISWNVRLLNSTIISWYNKYVWHLHPSSRNSENIILDDNNLIKHTLLKRFWQNNPGSIEYCPFSPFLSTLTKTSLTSVECHLTIFFFPMGAFKT